MKKILLFLIVVLFCLISVGSALASEEFSSPAAAYNFYQYGNLSPIGNISLLISYVEQNNATEMAYRTYGCSTGCSVGCSNGCSVGCSTGCSVGCSTGCKW